MIPEFEAILDKKEKSMGDPEEIFAFVYVYFEKFSNKHPHQRIQDLLALKDIFDKTHGSTAVPTFGGTSRKERRAMERSHTKSATKKKKGKK